VLLGQPKEPIVPAKLRAAYFFLRRFSKLVVRPLLLPGLDLRSPLVSPYPSLNPYYGHA
jgi:hypothetical protein